MSPRRPRILSRALALSLSIALLAGCNPSSTTTMANMGVEAPPPADAASQANNQPGSRAGDMLPDRKVLEVMPLTHVTGKVEMRGEPLKGFNVEVYDARTGQRLPILAGGVIAAGGYNFLGNASGTAIAAGGANVIGNASGTAIAAGGANVIGNASGTAIAAGGANAIAAGGANAIAAGGGNAIAAGGANVIAAGGANVIAAGGANVIAAGGYNLTTGAQGNFDFKVAGLVPGQAINIVASSSYARMEAVVSGDQASLARGYQLFQTGEPAVDVTLSPLSTAISRLASGILRTSQNLSPQDAAPIIAEALKSLDALKPAIAESFRRSPSLENEIVRHQPPSGALPKVVVARRALRTVFEGLGRVKTDPPARKGLLRNLMSDTLVESVAKLFAVLAEADPDFRAFLSGELGKLVVAADDGTGAPVGLKSYLLRVDAKLLDRETLKPLLALVHVTQGCPEPDLEGAAAIPPEVDGELQLILQQLAAAERASATSEQDKNVTTLVFNTGIGKQATAAAVESLKAIAAKGQAEEAEADALAGRLQDGKRELLRRLTQLLAMVAGDAADQAPERVSEELNALIGLARDQVALESAAKLADLRRRRRGDPLGLVFDGAGSQAGQAQTLGCQPSEAAALLAVLEQANSPARFKVFQQADRAARFAALRTALQQALQLIATQLAETELTQKVLEKKQQADEIQRKEAPVPLVGTRLVLALDPETGKVVVTNTLTGKTVDATSDTLDSVATVTAVEAIAGGAQVPAPAAPTSRAASLAGPIDDEASVSFPGMEAISAPAGMAYTMLATRQGQDVVSQSNFNPSDTGSNAIRFGCGGQMIDFYFNGAGNLEAISRFNGDGTDKFYIDPELDSTPHPNFSTATRYYFHHTDGTTRSDLFFESGKLVGAILNLPLGADPQILENEADYVKIWFMPDLR